MKIKLNVVDANPALELNTDSFLPEKERRFVYGHKTICVTDNKGHATPNGQTLTELKLDASEGFIPLWAKDVTLNWRFSPSFAKAFKQPAIAMATIKSILAEAIMAWKDACPVKFKENNDNWDFEIKMHKEDCDDSGCTLAQAFFPDGGRHPLYIYPKMLQQKRADQVATLVHELGHVFGLRHFFADISEKKWKSETFGTNNPFSIMNYGNKSKLMPYDINDLKTLYTKAWDGSLKEVNGTPIMLVKPFHTLGT